MAPITSTVNSMWAGNIPDDQFWRLLPLAIVVALCLWGMIWPRSQWRLLWGWQSRYHHVAGADERARLVRRSLVVPLIVSIIAGILLWPQR